MEATPAKTPIERVTIAEGRPALFMARTLEEHLKHAPNVAVFTVLGYEDVSLGGPFSALPEDPLQAVELPDQPGFPTVVRFAVRVDEVVTGSISTDAAGVAYVAQVGGYRGDIAFEMEGDPLLVVGSTYLGLFDAEGFGPGGLVYWTSGLARFEVVGDRLVSVGWDTGAARELGGRTLAVARGLIRTAARPE